MSRSKPSIENQLSSFKELYSRPMALIYPVALKRIKQGICIKCQRHITHFRDETSLCEYRISGLCQSCQDALFID